MLKRNDERKTCHRCGGRGSCETLGVGYAVIFRQCPRCQGTGHESEPKNTEEKSK